jgi:hypothetical protein
MREVDSEVPYVINGIFSWYFWCRLAIYRIGSGYSFSVDGVVSWYVEIPCYFQSTHPRMSAGISKITTVFAKHLVQHQHTLLPIEDCLTILHHQKKGRMLNTMEQFHIYKAAKTGNHLNDQYTYTHNAIFETVLRYA